MKVLQLILALAALVQVTIQSFRHAYYLVLEPRESVLTKFDKTETDIFKAKTLDELLPLYEEALKQVEAWEEGKSDKEKALAEGGLHLEPHKSKAKLRTAIQEREGHHKQILELHFYWWCGFACLLVGVLAYACVSSWLGMGFVITGFAEMIWWTTPTWGVFSSGDEFARLLIWKLVYSAAALALLLGVWWLLGFRFRTSTPNS